MSFVLLPLWFVAGGKLVVLGVTSGFDMVELPVILPALYMLSSMGQVYGFAPEADGTCLY